MSHVRSSGWIVFLAVLGLALSGCGDKAGGDGDGGGAAKTPAGADSPEDVIAKVAALAEKKDFGAFVNLVAPEERGVMSFSMVMVAQLAPMMSGFAAMGGEDAKEEMEAKVADFQKAVTAVFKKHGIPDLEKMAASGEKPEGLMDAVKMLEKAAPDLDHAAFVGDVIETISLLGDEVAAKSTSKFEKLGGKLTDLQVDGDTATGKIGDEEIHFKRVDGRWYISIAHEMEGMGMGMGDGPR